MTRVIKLTEVKRHNTQDSLWMVIHNEVYDVTKFLDEHPGGPESLLDFAGEDGTDAFEEVGHSSDARELLKKFKVGSLCVQDRKLAPCSNKLKWAVLALAGAVIIGLVMKKYLVQ